MPLRVVDVVAGRWYTKLELPTLVCAGMIDLSTVTLEVSGTVDYKSVGGIRENIERLIAEGHKRVSLDCAKTDFFDSCGIGLLVSIGRSLKTAGGGLQVISPGTQLRHALETAGFSSLVDLVETKAHTPTRKPSVGCTYRRISLKVPTSVDHGRQIRRRVMELAENMPFTNEALEDIKLAVGEAVTNAIRHGNWQDAEARIEVNATADDRALTVEITNPSEPFDHSSRPLPAPDNLQEGGLGIHFMHSCMDSVNFLFTKGKATVKMVKHLRLNDGE